MNENIKKKLNQPPNLRKVEGIEIISLMDNSVDFLSTVKRRKAQNIREWIKEWD